MGSPRGVPVPCISRTATSAGDESENAVPPLSPLPQFAPPASPPQAAKSAARSTLCCAGPEGAVRAAERPSWLTAEPASSASGGAGRWGEEAADEAEEEEVEEEEEREEGSSSPSSSSVSHLSTSSSTHASALPYPSAEPSSVLQRASAASIPARESTAGVSDRSERLTPPARPRREEDEEPFSSPLFLFFFFLFQLPEASSLKNEDTVRCIPTSDAEHAVSTATQAPLSPSANDSLPAAADSVPEVAESADSCPASEALR